MPFCQVDYKHGGGLITLREGQLWCKYSSVKVILNCIHSFILLINGNSAQCYPLEHSVTTVKPLVTSQYLLLSFNPLNHLLLQNWWSAQSPKMMNQCSPSNLRVVLPIIKDKCMKSHWWWQLPQQKYSQIPAESHLCLLDINNTPKSHLSIQILSSIAPFYPFEGGLFCAQVCHLLYLYHSFLESAPPPMSNGNLSGVWYQRQIVGLNFRCFVFCSSIETSPN